MTQFVHGLAARQPVLLVVEDVHWCDESSLDLLLQLIRTCADQPIVFLCTYRTEEISPGLRHWLAQLDRERIALELALVRLSQADVAAMLQAILVSPDQVQSELIDTIFTLAEGNPFFVEEVVKSLLASGDLRDVDGTWEHRSGRREPGGLAVIPRSVQDTVRQRADRLSAAAKEAVTLAAVAGRRFDVTVLQQVLGCDDDDLLRLVRELIVAQLIVEESADQFAFRHALVRHAISGELLARERRSLHGRIAAALETLYVDPPLREAHLADLAHHFYAADDWAKAREYGQRAGERALALHAPGAAIEHLTHAVGAAAQLHETPPSTVYHARGQAYETRGDFDRARNDYERALGIAQAASDGVMAWRSMMGLGGLWAGRDYAEAGAWFRRASEQASDLADPTLRARSLNRLGNWLSNTGRAEEGLQAQHEALAVFTERQDTRGMAETFDLLGTAYGMRGDRVRAVDLLGQAIALFWTLDDTPRLFSSLAMRAVQSMPGACETIWCPLRTRDACVDDAAESLRLARQADSAAGEAYAENVLALTLLSFGEFGPALAHAQTARRNATEIAHQQWMAATSYSVGSISLLLLAPAPAIAALEAGLSLARALGSEFWAATIAANLSLAHLLNDDLPAVEATLQAVMPREQHARTAAERAIALAWGSLALAQDEPGTALRIADQLISSAPGAAPSLPPQAIPHLLRLRGMALMALSRLDEAVKALDDARRGAEERNARPVLWTIHHALGTAYRLSRRDDQAREAFAAGRRLIEELAATIDDALLGDEFRRAALDSFPKERVPGAREAARRAFGGLTAREREVAALVAQGKTSREIADLLVVSERTAEVHVSNILGKLGFTSRAQIAVWAVERGLM